MISLKQAKGSVPIHNNSSTTPYLLVAYPDRQQFDALYKKSTKKELLDRYWNVLQKRSKGASLLESGSQFGLTRERVRQIEAKFIRLVGESYWKETSDTLFIAEHMLTSKKIRHALETDSLETVLPSGSNH